MKIKIPEALKADVPPTGWGRVLNATPVVMTVIATMLAGLSSGEMTRAQYERSLATQEQSKAGDQWGFFQAKRLRGAMQSAALDLLKNTTEVHPLEPGAFRVALGPLADEDAVRNAVGFLTSGQLPPSGPAAPPDPKVEAALDALDANLGGPELTRALTDATEAAVTAALRAAADQARAFDQAMAPVTRAIDHVADALDSQRAEKLALNRDFAALRLRFAIRRYEAEARLNQAIANLYELQVRKSNLSAERHMLRSQRFFYGMLAAQAGVIIATFAIAARKKNFLWSIAAAAGAGAVSFAIYVYLFL